MWANYQDLNAVIKNKQNDFMDGKKYESKPNWTEPGELYDAIWDEALWQSHIDADADETEAGVEAELKLELELVRWTSVCVIFIELQTTNDLIKPKPNRTKNYSECSKRWRNQFNIGVDYQPKHRSTAPDSALNGRKKNKRSCTTSRQVVGEKTGMWNVGRAMSRDATESEAFIYDLISCTFDITIAVNASSF